MPNNAHAVVDCEETAVKSWSKASGTAWVGRFVVVGVAAALLLGWLNISFLQEEASTTSAESVPVLEPLDTTDNSDFVCGREFTICA